MRNEYAQLIADVRSMARADMQAELAAWQRTLIVPTPKVAAAFVARSDDTLRGTIVRIRAHAAGTAHDVDERIRINEALEATVLEWVGGTLGHWQIRKDA